MDIRYFPLILLWPLLGVLVNAVLGKRLPLRASGGVASFAVLLSFLTALGGFFALRGMAGGHEAEAPRLVFPLWQWIASGDFSVSASLLLDPLSAVMILVVIFIPSVKLLYFMDKAEEADMTLKVTGRQWYWSYEYPDNGGFSYDSYMVEDEDIHLTISTFNANLEMAGQQLIRLSNDHGGKDNVSVILAQVVEPFPARVSMLQQIRSIFS